MAINPKLIIQREGATYYVTQEPTEAELLLFPLPVNFKVVDTATNTFRLVSYKADGTRLEMEGGGGAPAAQYFKLVESGYDLLSYVLKQQSSNVYKSTKDEIVFNLGLNSIEEVSQWLEDNYAIELRDLYDQKDISLMDDAEYSSYLSNLLFYYNHNVNSGDAWVTDVDDIVKISDLFDTDKSDFDKYKDFYYYYNNVSFNDDIGDYYTSLYAFAYDYYGLPDDYESDYLTPKLDVPIRNSNFVQPINQQDLVTKGYADSIRAKWPEIQGDQKDVNLKGFTDGVGHDVVITPQSLSGHSGFTDVTFGNGVFVACVNSASNNIAYSVDGISWNIDTSFLIFIDIVFNGTKFLAICYNPTTPEYSMKISLDGITWEDSDYVPDTPLALSDLQTAKGLFIVADGGTYKYSVDGVIWTEMFLPPSLLRFCSYVSGYFVFLSANKYIVRVPESDMTSYQTFEIDPEYTGNTYHSMVSAQDVVFALGNFNSNTTNVLRRSLDFGVTWETVEHPSLRAGLWRKLIYANNMFLAIPSNTGLSVILYSKDGEVWSHKYTGVPRNYFDVSYGNDQFVAVGTGTGNGQVLTILYKPEQRFENHVNEFQLNGKTIEPKSKILNIDTGGLEAARKRGNVLEGNVELSYPDGYFRGFIFNHELDSDSGKITGWGVTDEGTIFFGILRESTKVPLTGFVPRIFGMELISEPDIKGIIGTNEFNKQGDRKAFAQLSDVYDANSYSTEETKIGGPWIDGKPIYRKVLNGVINTSFKDIDVSDLFISQCKISGFLNHAGNFFPIGTIINVFCGQAWFYEDTIRIQSSQDLNASIPVTSEYSIILEYTKTTDTVE